MTFAAIQWIYVITAFLIGGGLGALAYHLMNASVAQNIKIRHQLTERELELNQLRDNLNDHFARTADGLNTMSRQLKDMESQLRNDAGQLCSDETLVKRLTDHSADDKTGTNQKTSKADSLVEPPRDYASDRGRGTLSEDFGLKPEIFEPPRS